LAAPVIFSANRYRSSAGFNELRLMSSVLVVFGNQLEHQQNAENEEGDATPIGQSMLAIRGDKQGAYTENADQKHHAKSRKVLHFVNSIAGDVKSRWSL
jgi:hypothetical protein